MARRSKRRSVDSAVRTQAVKQACPLSKWSGKTGLCHWCDTELIGRRRSWCSAKCQRLFETNHVWSIARRTVRQRAGYQCEQCGSRTSLEVNHIDPVIGRGYSLSCLHHLANLEVLCHSCHVQVTNQQRAARIRED